ncbi:glycosyltransferase family 4 protein [Caballeronia concitans]|uniref:Glycosyl transferase family 1 n=1 Tax=Caballeronia concitans TaxID=1777133 RepID=A0A658QT07_9BURK|nr:glycosyltransferase family 4 protein [Caballeronia concitans]KIG11042.1 glycosyl transferase group 1 [Burkholderia sp. MR1]SAL17666.1 glycosyl transferase family 1 [Caballeronia concitans]
MKILLTNFHDGRGGGHDTYIVAIAQALSARHQMFVAAPGTSRLIEHARAVPGITVLPMDFPAKIKDFPRMRAAWRALRTLIQRQRFDVIHVNGSPDHRLLLLVMLWWKGHRPRIVFTKHNSIAIKRDFLTRLRAMRATDAVIAVAESTAQLVQQSVYAHCPVTVVKNGIDLGRYAPRDIAGADEQRKALLGPERAKRLVIGTVTGFDSYKGTMDMIAAVAALPDALREQVVVVVVGTEPNDEQRQSIDALDMKDHVQVVGFVENVADFIATFDVGFVLSYAVETVSFACREMMAMAKPVIVTRYAGLPENIDDGLDGWIVEPRDVEALSATLESIITGRSQLPAIGARARARAVREFSSKRFIDATEAVYRRVAPVVSARTPHGPS